MKLIVDYQNIFRLFATLNLESSLSIWTAVLDSLGWLYAVMSHSFDTREIKWLADFVNSKLIGIYTKLGPLLPMEKSTNSILQNTIITHLLRFENENIKKDLDIIYQDWLKRESSHQPHKLLKHSICAKIQDGGKNSLTTFEFIWQKYRNSTSEGNFGPFK